MFHNLSVIRHKGESQNLGNKKTKHLKFSEKRLFLKTVRFSENLTGFIFFINSVSSFALLPYYRRTASLFTLGYTFANHQVINLRKYLS